MNHNSLWDKAPGARRILKQMPSANRDGSHSRPRVAPVQKWQLKMEVFCDDCKRP